MSDKRKNELPSRKIRFNGEVYKVPSHAMIIDTDFTSYIRVSSLLGCLVYYEVDGAVWDVQVYDLHFNLHERLTRIVGNSVRNIFPLSSAFRKSFSVIDKTVKQVAMKSNSKV